MTYLAACTVATLLLAVFIATSLWLHIAREVQHKRHLREKNEVLCKLALETGKAQDFRDVNRAGERLDATMRRTIEEGLELAHLLDAKNQEFAALVVARGAQRAQEDSTLEVWIKIRDDITAWAEQYPSWMFQGDESERGQG